MNLRCLLFEDIVHSFQHWFQDLGPKTLVFSYVSALTSHDLLLVVQRFQGQTSQYRGLNFECHHVNLQSSDCLQNFLSLLSKACFGSVLAKGRHVRCSLASAETETIWSCRLIFI